MFSTAASVTEESNLTQVVMKSEREKRQPLPTSTKGTMTMYKSKFLMNEMLAFSLAMEGNKLPLSHKQMPSAWLESLYAEELSSETLLSYVTSGISDFYDMLIRDMSLLDRGELIEFFTGYHNRYAPSKSFDLPAFRVLEAYELLMDKRGRRNRNNNHTVEKELRTCIDNPNRNRNNPSTQGEFFESREKWSDFLLNLPIHHTTRHAFNLEMYNLATTDAVDLMPLLSCANDVAGECCMTTSRKVVNIIRPTLALVQMVREQKLKPEAE